MTRRRALVLAAALVVAGMIVLGLAAPRDVLTGANGVRPIQIVTVAQPGVPVCVDATTVPGGSEAIQVVVGPVSGRGTVSATLTASDGSVARASAPLAALERTTLDFGAPIAGRDQRLCLRSDGARMNVTGRLGTIAGASPIEVGRTRVTGMLALWFAPPAGTRDSIAGHWGEIIERAGVLQPGVVRGGLLFVVLTLLVPAAAVIAVWCVGWPTRRAGIVLTAVALVSTLSWAVMLVPFDAPDEPEHFAYVQSLAERGERPDQVPTSRPAYSGRQVALLDTAAHRLRIGSDEQRPPWTADARRVLADRSSAGVRADDGGGFTESTRAHAPLYYGYASLGYRLAGSDIRAQLTGARIASGLLMVIVVLCAFGIVREMVPREPGLAALAGVLVALHPGLSFVAGAVNNDAGVNALAAVIALLGVRLLRRGATWPTLLAFAVCLAVAPLVKATALSLYPPALGVLAALAWRERRVPRGLLRLAGFAGAFGVAALGARALLFGSGDTPAGQAIDGGGSLITPVGAKLSYTWQTFFPRLPFMVDHAAPAWPFFDVYVVGGWGVFGWFTAIAPQGLAYVITGAGGVLVALGVAAAWQRRGRIREWAPTVVFLVSVPVCVLVGVAFAYYTPTTREVPAEQGRYLFTAAAPLAALGAMSLLGLPATWRRTGAVVLAIAMAGLAVAARLTYLESLFT